MCFLTISLLLSVHSIAWLLRISSVSSMMCLTICNLGAYLFRMNNLLLGLSNMSISNSILSCKRLVETFNQVVHVEIMNVLIVLHNLGLCLTSWSSCHGISTLNMTLPVACHLINHGSTLIDLNWSWLWRVLSCSSLSIYTLLMLIETVDQTVHLVVVVVRSMDWNDHRFINYSCSFNHSRSLNHSRFIDHSLSWLLRLIETLDQIIHMKIMHIVLLDRCGILSWRNSLGISNLLIQLIVTDHLVI